MIVSRRTVVTRAGAAALALGLMQAASPLHAQDFPTRAITIIVPSSAGGPAYVTARLIADRFSQALKQPVVVETVPGAGGTIGMGRLARAAPDGYTLMIHQNGFAITPAIYDKLPFDTEKDFVTVGMINRSETFVVGRPTLPANNFKELVAWMKGPGKPARIAHPGVGTNGHLAATMFVRALELEPTMVAYKGIGPAVNDIVGGHVDVTQVGASAAAPLIKDNRIKVFASTGFSRNPHFPDIPTLGELGYNIQLWLWMGLFAPAGTPQPVLETLNAALRETLADARTISNFEASLVQRFPDDQMSVKASGDYVRDQIALWGKVVRENNIKGH